MALDTSPGLIQAFEVLSSAQFSDERVLNHNHFDWARNSMAQLLHDNIVRVRDLGYSKGLSCTC